MSVEWSDVRVTLSRLEAVTLLRLLIERHQVECQAPAGPLQQLHCEVLESVINKLWIPALQQEESKPG